MPRRLYKTINFITFLLLLISFRAFSQETPSMKFVVEKGKFLFDNQTYKIYQKQTKETLESQRKGDSLSKANPKIHVMPIDDRILEFPKFDSATVIFRNKIFENLKINNVKFGKNTFSIFIDKYGKIVNFKCVRKSDNKIYKQLKNMIVKKDFNKWKPANYYGTTVNFDFRFSIIVDSSFSKYDLKNKWSQETNLQDFIKK